MFNQSQPSSQHLLRTFAPALLVLGGLLVWGVALAQSTSKSSDQAGIKLGSLMLTPIQRQNLEFLRHSGADAARTGPAGDELLDPRAGIPETILVSGVVIRSGNRSTVWLNNQPLYGQKRAGALSDLAAQTGVVTGGHNNMQVRTKPGQTIDVPTREATDLLPPGAIKIIPPKAGSAGNKKE
ncbi:MAG: hypothetical protein WBK51_02005 [Polaromonas sp.]